MQIDWSAAISALVGALLVVIVGLRWRKHTRSRNIHFQFDWHSKAQDDAVTKEKDNDYPG